MKHLSLILNGVLAVAVGILYYLHFSSSNGGSTPAATESSDSLTVVAEETVDTTTVFVPDSLLPKGNIAYVNLDVLTEKYQFYKDGIKALQNEYKAKQKELVKRQKKWEEDVQRYQQLAPTMNQETREIKEQQLAADQEKLYGFRDELEGSLASKDAEFTKQFLTKLDGYFKGMAKEKNYDYVFVYSKGGPSYIVYANESLNITNHTLQGLNSQYKKK